MGLLAPLAAFLGIEAESIVARTKVMVAVYAAIAVLSMLAAGFLIASGYIALAASVGSLYAALIFGGGFAVLALVVYLGAMIGQSRRRRKVAERRRSSEAGAFLTTAALTALPAVMRSPLVIKLGLPAAAVAAFLMMRDNRDD